MPICKTSITPAESRILAELCDGHTNRAIAHHLVLSARTVESHVSNLLAKTGCQNRTQLVLWSLSLQSQQEAAQNHLEASESDKLQHNNHAGLAQR